MNVIITVLEYLYWTLECYSGLHDFNIVYGLELRFNKHQSSIPSASHEDVCQNVIGYCCHVIADFEVTWQQSTNRVLLCARVPQTISDDFCRILRNVLWMVWINVWPQIVLLARERSVGLTMWQMCAGIISLVRRDNLTTQRLNSRGYCERNKQLMGVVTHSLSTTRPRILSDHGFFLMLL